MVTSFGNHWDNIGDKKTQYPIFMFRNGMCKDKITERTQTIFIKRNAQRPEQFLNPRLQLLT